MTSSVLQPHSDSVSTSTSLIAVIGTPKFVRASINISSAASQNTQNSEVYTIMQLHLPHGVFVTAPDIDITSVFIVLSLVVSPDYLVYIRLYSEIWDYQSRSQL